MRTTLRASLVLLSIALGQAFLERARAGEQVPLRIDAPEGADPDAVLPVTGGIPFPRGALASVSHVRVTSRGKEVPAQVTRAAVWPDGSVKWAFVDIVRAPAASGSLRLEYGPDVRRAEVPEPLRLVAGGGGVRVTGPGLAGTVAKGSGGIGALEVAGRKALAGGVRLRLDAVRVAGPEAFRGPSRVCRDGKARVAAGRVVVEEVRTEVAGPIRGRVLVRGHLRVAGWGSGLPRRVLSREPPERIPFSLRWTFWRGVPAILGDHQIVFTGEPDRDFIVRWGVDLPGQGAGTVRRIVEPGLTLDLREAEDRAVTGIPGRLCWAPIRDGGVLVRGGWQNRPTEVGGEEGAAARIDFWPEAAGPWDLRRYAREWAVGETGDKEDAAAIERYARYAARGMAKSQAFVIHLGEGGEERARALSEPALLTAPPGWYAASGVFGDYAPEVTSGAWAKLDAGLRRSLDWYRFNQDLFRWHGMLAYGFWQHRYGVHRHDRWDRDYGRWGWSLNDGAGRVGHVLMLEYLRTLDRRYFLAGEAFARAAYDTAMVHTDLHLENARSNWWTVRGCTHRHNVQPFGCPYIGMRGSHPYAQRILYFLTDDGVIRDGLDLVAATALEFATTRPGAFGGSGGPDGQGSGALALLFAHEATGEARYLEACRAILDKSGLVPPKDERSMGYGPDFGLFLAAGEYLSLTGDGPFRRRFLALADRAVAAKKPEKFLTVLAQAVRLSKEAKYRKALERALSALDFTGSLAELPVRRWPGHAGPREPPSRANVGWALPYALAALSKTGTGSPGRWPRPTVDPVRLPARPPEGWFRPAGRPGKGEAPPDPARLLGRKPPRGGGALSAGPARWTVESGKLSSVTVAGVECLSGPVRPWVMTAKEAQGGARVLGRESPGKGTGKFGASGGKAAAAGREGGVRYHVALSAAQSDGVPLMRVRMAVEVPKREGALAGFGVRIPLRLSDRPRAIHVEAGGAFRTERWRVDQSDEAIPEWRNSDRLSRWPRWRGGGILLGPADSYRIYKQNRPDTSPVFVDEGFGAPGWLDVIDRGGETHWGVTVRVLRDPKHPLDGLTRAVRFDAERGEVAIDFQSPSGSPLAPGAGPYSGEAHVVFHDGWRPPLAKPELTREQYRKLLDDLDYGGNIGLFALRFLLSETHQVRGDQWKDLLADRGVEPRELLLSMQWHDALARHCKKIGVRHTPEDPDATTRQIIDHYR